MEKEKIIEWIRFYWYKLIGRAIYDSKREDRNYRMKNLIKVAAKKRILEKKEIYYI